MGAAVPVRLIPIALVLLLAGCGIDDVSAGVEVVTVADSADPTRGDADPPTRTQTADGDDEEGVGVVTGDDASSDVVAIEPVSQPMPSSVAVVGDSLTLAAENEIEAALTRLGLDVLVIDGLESRRMVRGGSELPPGVDAIDDVLDAGLEPELWIIALGTNDIGSGSSPDSFDDDVVSVLTRIPPGAPVIWVDLWIRDRSAATAEANGAIRSVAALRPAMRVVDWHTHGDDPGIITRDGIHLTEDGQRLFAASMASVVDAMFPN